MRQGSDSGPPHKIKNVEIIAQVFIFFAQIFSFPFLFFFPFHRFHLSYSISPLAHLIIVPCSQHPPPKKKEKEKNRKKMGKQQILQPLMASVFTSP